MTEYSEVCVWEVCCDVSVWVGRLGVCVGGMLGCECVGR